MRSAVSLLTVAALALHLMLGCQWHHAHAVEVSPGKTAPQAACEHSHAGNVDVFAHQHAEPESVPAENGDCDQIECVYVVAGKVSLELTSDSLLAIFPGPVAHSLASLSPQLLPAPLDAAAAVRPHLLFQVLLI